MSDDPEPDADVTTSDDDAEQRRLEVNRRIREALTRPPSPAALRLVDALHDAKASIPGHPAGEERFQPCAGEAPRLQTKPRADHTHRLRRTQHVKS